MARRPERCSLMFTELLLFVCFKFPKMLERLLGNVWFCSLPKACSLSGDSCKQQGVNRRRARTGIRCPKDGKPHPESKITALSCLAAPAG